MTRWEYKRTAPMSVEDMNSYGARGWELVAVVQPVNAARHAPCDLYWKRATSNPAGDPSSAEPEERESSRDALPPPPPRQ